MGRGIDPGEGRKGVQTGILVGDWCHREGSESGVGGWGAFRPPASSLWRGSLLVGRYFLVGIGDRGPLGVDVDLCEFRRLVVLKVPRDSRPEPPVRPLDEPFVKVPTATDPRGGWGRQKTETPNSTT